MSLSPEERKKVASANGKKSGEARTKEAETKILTALNIMQSFEMKITIRALAERSGTSKDTVQKYLKKTRERIVSTMKKFINIYSLIMLIMYISCSYFMSIVDSTFGLLMILLLPQQNTIKIKLHN